MSLSLATVALSGLLGVPALGLLAGAAVPSYRVSAPLNVVFCALTLLCAGLLYAHRPEPSLYLLVDDVNVGRIGDGEIFGAMAALTQADRSATVRAKTTCSIVKVPKEQFTELIKSNPATIHSLLIDMANSIVNLNEQLIGLQGNHRGNHQMQ